MMTLLTSLMPILSALGPVFSMIVFGWYMNRRGFPGAAFWAPAERLTYFILFPALLIKSLATAPLGDVVLTSFVMVLVIGVVSVALLLRLLWPLFDLDGPGFTSILQGSVRFNTYVGLAIVQALLGDTGLALAAVAIATLIPVVNVLSIAALNRYGNSSGAKRTLFGSLLSNPLVLACIVGISLNLTGVGLPVGTVGMIDIFSRAALPLGLLAVGAGLSFSALSGRTSALSLAVCLKLFVLPALSYGLARWFVLPPEQTTVLVLFSALPAAPSAYILARQLGGDAPLVAGVLTMQTVLAVLTLPIILVLIR